MCFSDMKKFLIKKRNKVEGGGVYSMIGVYVMEQKKKMNERSIVED